MFALSVPANPVKFRLRIPPVKVMMSDPAETLKSKTAASEAPLVSALAPTAPEYVRLTVREPLTDRPVIVLQAQTVVLFPVMAKLPVPKAIVRALELLEMNEPQVNVLLLSVKVPVVSVTAPVMVGEPDKLRLISAVLIVQADAVAVDATVTVAAVPLFASKVTVSADVGADASGGPPEVADQLSMDTLSHVPDPPTQNRAAIT